MPSRNSLASGRIFQMASRIAHVFRQTKKSHIPDFASSPIASAFLFRDIFAGSAGAGSAIVMVTCITIDLISNIMRSTRRFTVTVCGSFIIVHCYWIECVDGSKSVLNCKQILPFSSYHKRAKQSFPRTLEFSVVQKSHKRSRSG